MNKNKNKNKNKKKNKNKDIKQEEISEITFSAM